MKTVHIPVYCPKVTNEQIAFLFLQTIRVGFPLFSVHVYWMGGNDTSRQTLMDICKEKGFDFRLDLTGTNIDLIEYLVKTQTEDFVVADSDLVFFDSVEDWHSHEFLSGELIPKFVCPIAFALTQTRLHTALLFINKPQDMLHKIKQLYRPLLAEFCPFNLFKPVVVYNEGKPIFYDGCSLLFHMLRGQAFDTGMLVKYEHLYAGPYLDTIKGHRKFVEEVVIDTSKAKGFRAEVMDKYYENLAP